MPASEDTGEKSPLSKQIIPALNISKENSVKFKLKEQRRLLAIAIASVAGPSPSQASPWEAELHGHVLMKNTSDKIHGYQSG
ncbi:hypothetical protein DPEC_G00347460 [Dallia pectoralis]|uniref:Uncharacterized protein n=1 Tax=Dallia pectoralis TaxID=75939 RepID=A0ACC2F445_DALPE|nr:hypothetical protein DPEC_G00347460 [Dallia pectoralis]